MSHRSSVPPTPAARTTRAAILVVALACLLAVIPGVQTRATAADLIGHDISWANCPIDEGGYGLPTPPSSSKFVIIGLTKGLAFGENPCLGSQVTWATDNSKPAQAYTVATYPTASQLSTYGASGPFSSSTKVGQLANVGYAEGQFALKSLAGVGWRPSVVWIGVTPLPTQPWPSATAAQQVENRSVVQGLARALRDAGFGYGVYSDAAGWKQTVGAWGVPGVPQWTTVGTLDYAEEASEQCTKESFGAGKLYLTQWTDPTRNYDRTCGSYAFTAVPKNLAGASGVQVTASSTDTGVSPSPKAAVDGAVGGYPTDTAMEWSSAQQKAGAWIELTWPSAVTLDRIVLNDRPNTDDQVTAGVLSFSDGSSLNVGSLPNDGAALNVSFESRVVTSLRFEATSVSASTWAAGLAEIEAWGVEGGTPVEPTGSNVAPTASTVTASSENTAAGQTAAKVIDGSADGYPGDATREWATVGGKSGSWVQLEWARLVTLDRVVLNDRPNASDRVTSAVLTFSDGTTVDVPTLNNDGRPNVVTFDERKTDSLKVTITSVSGTTQNVGLAELEAWGTPAPAENMSRQGAQATASSENTATGQTAAKAIDGSADGYPGDSKREWSTLGGRSGSWIQLTWPSPVTLDKVVLNDRPNSSDQVTSATLTFSDGSTVNVPSLNNGGRETTVTFAQRATTSVRLLITGVSGTTQNVGLAEFEAWGTPGGTVVPPTTLNVARSGAQATASSENAAGGQTAAKAIDGSPNGYPGDSSREWATVGGRAGSWIQLAWAAPVSIDRVVLNDRPNTSDRITGATLTFTDGSTVDVPSLDNDGAATTVTFTRRTTQTLRLTITGVSGTTENVGLAELEVWGRAASTDNLARTGAQATASSENTASGQTAAKAIDGAALGYPGDSSREWASVGGKGGSWLQLKWASAVQVDRVVLYDRPNTSDQITGATLMFSDGSSVSVPALSNDGTATWVTFPQRATDSVRLTVTTVSGTTQNVGLAELEVWNN